MEVRVESGGTSRDLPQPLTITGNRFAFDNAGFSPASGTVYVASTNPVMRLNWASNQAESPAVLYTLLGRHASSGAGSTFAILGSTNAKTLEVNTGTNTLLEWKVVALWEGQEFVSSTRSGTIAPVGAPAAPVVVAGGRDTALPWMEVSWPAQPGVDGVVLYRKDLRTNTVEELARPAGTSYRDEAVAYGDSFAYSLATVVGGEVSPPGGEASVTLTPLLPLGITFVNANYEARPANANTVAWNPVLPAGVTSVYQEYLATLRTGDGAIVQSQFLGAPTVPGGPVSITYTGLEYSQSYVVEVLAYAPDGSALSGEPVRLFFSTGFDTRLITVAPVVTVVQDAWGLTLTWNASPNADHYDIFRSTGGGALTWLGRSLGTSYSDTTVPPGTSASYVVRARNDNTFLDSAATPAVVLETFRITGVTRTGPGGQDVTLSFTTLAGAAYRVQQSSSLAAGSWTETGVSATGTGTAQSLTVPAAVTGGAPRRYFRVVRE